MTPKYKDEKSIYAQKIIIIAEREKLTSLPRTQAQVLICESIGIGID